MIKNQGVVRVNQSLFHVVAGIGIVQRKFDVVRLQNNQPKHKSFPNTPEGFVALIVWLGTLDSIKQLIYMKLTGAYSIPLAEYLADAGFPASVVNPAKIKAFAQSELVRAKTDKSDARLIARYALEKQPPLWTLHHRPTFALCRPFRAA